MGEKSSDAKREVVSEILGRTVLKNQVEPDGVPVTARTSAVQVFARNAGGTALRRPDFWDGDFFIFMIFIIKCQKLLKKFPTPSKL